MTEGNPNNLGKILQKLEGEGIAQDTILVRELKNRIGDFSKMYAITLREYYKRASSTAREVDIASNSQVINTSNTS